MIFEFAGLPGSGKSTIFTAAAERLRQAGYDVDTMRMLSKKALEEGHRKIGFLRRRISRASLYGALSFAQSHPDLFDALYSGARGDLSTNMWNMEMLSQIHFASWGGLPDQPVFMDEGYLHRGAATFLLTRNRSGFGDYMALVPTNHVVIHVTTSVEIALARAQGRKLKKRVPAAWVGASDEETRATLDYFNDLVTFGCDALKQRGGRVIEIDGSLPVAASAAIMADAVIEAQTLASHAASGT